MSKQSSASSSGFPIIGILFVILVTGKLAGWFSISWFWVFAIPIIASILWLVFGVMIVIGIVFIIAALKVWIETSKKKSKYF